MYWLITLLCPSTHFAYKSKITSYYFFFIEVKAKECIQSKDWNILSLFKSIKLVLSALIFQIPKLPMSETLTLSKLNRNICLPYCKVMLQNLYFPYVEDLLSIFIYFSLQSYMKGKGPY